MRVEEREKDQRRPIVWTSQRRKFQMKDVAHSHKETENPAVTTVIVKNQHEKLSANSCVCFAIYVIPSDTPRIS